MREQAENANERFLLPTTKKRVVQMLDESLVTLLDVALLRVWCLVASQGAQTAIETMEEHLLGRVADITIAIEQGLNRAGRCLLPGK